MTPPTDSSEPPHSDGAPGLDPVRKSKRGRVLAIDYGARRIGLAISDDRRIMANPLKTIIGAGSIPQDAAAIAETLQRENCAAAIVGLPLNMDGTAGQQAKLSRRFRDALAAATPIPVTLIDERLTTFAATEQMRAMDVPPSRRAEIENALAAAALLTSYLSSADNS